MGLFYAAGRARRPGLPADPSLPPYCMPPLPAGVCLFGVEAAGEKEEFKQPFSNRQKRLSEIIGHFPSHLFRIAILDTNPAPSHNPVRRLGTWCATALPLDQGPGLYKESGSFFIVYSVSGGGKGLGPPRIPAYISPHDKNVNQYSRYHVLFKDCRERSRFFVPLVFPSHRCPRTPLGVALPLPPPVPPALQTLHPAPSQSPHGFPHHPNLG